MLFPGNHLSFFRISPALRMHSDANGSKFIQFPFLCFPAAAAISNAYSFFSVFVHSFCQMPALSSAKLQQVSGFPASLYFYAFMEIFYTFTPAGRFAADSKQKHGAPHRVFFTFPRRRSWHPLPTWPLPAGGEPPPAGSEAAAAVPECCPGSDPPGYGTVLHCPAPSDL